MPYSLLDASVKDVVDRADQIEPEPVDLIIKQRNLSALELGLS